MMILLLLLLPTYRAVGERRWVWEHGELQILRDRFPRHKQYTCHARESAQTKGRRVPASPWRPVALRPWQHAVDTSHQGSCCQGDRVAIVTTTTSCFKFQHVTRLVAMVTSCWQYLRRSCVSQAGFSVDLHIASGIFFSLLKFCNILVVIYQRDFIFVIMYRNTLLLVLCCYGNCSYHVHTLCYHGDFIVCLIFLAQYDLELESRMGNNQSELRFFSPSWFLSSPLLYSTWRI